MDNFLLYPLLFQTFFAIFAFGERKLPPRHIRI